MRDEDRSPPLGRKGRRQDTDVAGDVALARTRIQDMASRWGGRLTAFPAHTSSGGALDVIAVLGHYQRLLAVVPVTGDLLGDLDDIECCMHWVLTRPVLARA